MSKFLNGKLLQEQVSAKTAKILHAPGGYLPFQWKSQSVSSDGFLAEAPKERGLTKLEATQLHAQVGLASLWRRVITIEDL
ncbi:MAG: hypothetical protein QOD99_1721, partial [Chthoniobacter sp.]|nr:hypothetical protein [Chthoniobacter sp.]